MLPTNGTKAVEFYDQRNDPQEWVNLAGRAECADTDPEIARFPPELNTSTEEKTGPQKRAQRTAVQYHYVRSYQCDTDLVPYLVKPFQLYAS